MMIKKNRLFLVFAIITILLSLLIGTSVAQDSNSQTKKKKSSANKTKKQSKTSKKEVEVRTIDRRMPAFQGSRKGDDSDKNKKRQDKIKISPKATAKDSRQIKNDKPESSRLIRGGTFNGDLRDIPYRKPALISDKHKKERLGENEILEGDPVEVGSGKPKDNFAPAPGPIANFIGLDLTNFGTGYPPDTVGDVGPNHFIQSVNGSVGIYDKSTGTRLVGLSLNSFMSVGSFGNLCDTANRGDPVVLYDTFEDRWIVTGFAFTTSGGAVTSDSYQCFAVSKTGDPVAGGWNYYFTVDTDFLGDYPKFGVWTDGIYMSANMFGFASGGAFAGVRVRALNKAQMYAGAPTVQVVVFNAPAGEFSLMPANARLQTGTPPPGTPNLFSVVWQFTNAISVYKFKVDWDKISTSSFTGPFISIAPTNWSSPPGSVPAMGGNDNDTLALRLMMQNQYTNIGGVESLWNSHTVRGATVSQAAVRYYQVGVTGGTVAGTTTQAATHNPDTENRYMPSLAVNRNGDMAIGYSVSSSTLPAAIRYAGRLATDPVDTLPQTETSLIDGPGAQTFTTRWGDYSTTTLDPNGCTFWLTNEYYAAVGSDWQTRIGSFEFPGCTKFVNNGTLSGTVTSTVTGNPINGATVKFGSRTATTNASGVYSFTNLPQGTYQTNTASATGFNSSTTTNIAITDGNTTTQDFSLGFSAPDACLVDTSQSDLQTGIPTNIDLTTNPGDATLIDSEVIDQQNTSVTTSGFGFTSTAWVGQTFTAGANGLLTKADVNLFCSSCTGTTPDITVAVRATSANLPTGPDLATATIPGFSSGAGDYYTAIFASPVTLTSGTQYALVIRAVSDPSAGTYAYVVSSGSPYSGGSRTTSADSGSTWIERTTDMGFRTYIAGGFASSGNLVSSTKDANPPVSGITRWTSLEWTATTPTNTTVSFQVAASNDPNGPFNFVGPDTTSGTFFTTSGASLSQFNGMRYLKYKAYLATTDSAATPTLQDVTICYSNSFESDVAAVTGNGAIQPNDVVQMRLFQIGASTPNPATNQFQRADSAPIGTLGDGCITPSDIVQTRLYQIGFNPLTPAGGPTTENCPALFSATGSSKLDKDGPDESITGTPRSIQIQNQSGSAGNPVAVSLIVDALGDESEYGFTVNFDSNVLTYQNTAAGSINAGTTLCNPVMPGVLNCSIGSFPDMGGGSNTLIGEIAAGNNQLMATLNFVVAGGASEGTMTNLTISNQSASDDATGSLVVTGQNGVVTVTGPTAAGTTVGGRVFSSSGRALSRVIVSVTNQNGEIFNTTTNQFGFYRFANIEVGQSYTFNVSRKGFSFTPQIVTVNERLTNLDFRASP